MELNYQCTSMQQTIAKKSSDLSDLVEANIY